MKRILVTGFNGFVGRHACVEFRNRGFEIIGVTDKVVDESAAKLVDRSITCDLADPTQTATLEFGAVDVVLNLAGFATNTGTDSERVHRINIGAHVNLYERIRNLGISPRIIAVSTGLVYDPKQQMPIDERGEIRDPDLARPYEASKVRMEQSIQPYIAEGMDIVIARPFNHIGPGQGPGFIVPDFSLEIEKQITTGSPIVTGSLSTERDYTGVADVVDAYACLAEAPSPMYRIYNICSGVPRTGREILALLCKEYGIDIPTKTEAESKFRLGEISQFYGSNNRIVTEFNWVPRKTVADTIHEYVQWRKALTTS